MQWYFNVRQTKGMIRAEIRPNEGDEGGYISAHKRIRPRLGTVTPATIMRNLDISAELFLEEALQLIEWLQIATLLASQLDHYITLPADFQKRFEAKQYNPEAWQSCCVYPVGSPTIYQQKLAEEWAEGRREE